MSDRNRGGGTEGLSGLSAQIAELAKEVRRLRSEIEDASRKIERVLRRMPK